MASRKVVAAQTAQSKAEMIDRERWERVESIYHAVLERDPDSRAAFLDEACGGDEQLRSIDSDGGSR